MAAVVVECVWQRSRITRGGLYVSIAQSGAVAGGMVVDQLFLLLVTLVSFHPLRSGHGQLPRGTSNDDIF